MNAVYYEMNGMARFCSIVNQYLHFLHEEY